MQPTIEQTRWLLKILQPDKTLGSLPGAAALAEPLCAALLGLPADLYAAELAHMREGLALAHPQRERRAVLLDGKAHEGCARA